MTIMIRKEWKKWWWIAPFAISCFFAYEQGVGKIDRDYRLLQQQYNYLAQKKQKALKTQKETMAQLNSQGDPAYVELLIMKELGVVPKNQRKVLFSIPATNRSVVSSKISSSGTGSDF